METDFETQLASNDSIITDSASFLPGDSSTFINSITSPTDFISEEIYRKRIMDHVHDLKTELQTGCHLDWLNEYEPSKHNPKIELNLLLHGVIRERTLLELALSKGINFSNDEQIIAEIFQNDYCLLQRICQELVSDQQQQRIIYTEILFRPDIFNFGTINSNIKLKDVIKMLIDCIRFFTTNNLVNGETNHLTESNPILNRITMDTLTPTNINLLPIHIKIILSCNWKNVKSFNQFICLARTHPNEIVGIDFYGDEDDCRQYWHDFCKYTKILRYYHIQYQASMNNYRDLQLIDDVVNGLKIERLSEAYEIILSSKHMENILVKHDVHLILCPTSDYYAIANSQLDNILSTNRKKRKHQSTSSLANSNNEKDSSDIPSFCLINYLQSNLINYSIASSSPIRYKQNLSFIYQYLLDKNKKNFTCEHMQWLNENALKSSFASQQLKTKLINYMRKNYTNCYKQTILLQQFRQTTDKWQQEMNDTIDRNAQIAIDLAMKIHKEKLIKRQMHRQEIQTKLFEEDNDDSQQE
ncbi:unnamed protein product [Rotaria magnacalcarata]|uniref:Uncharacterized protein n=2 Tax=Rotaria magnacalcarata TaxID=392030 RepID=A0A815YFA9_9BILA|nr:unnamed protein product [Rotaria magnacalcarata]CAF4615863.1 unnamed protein product [Rotaria magnacalcarata]